MPPKTSRQVFLHRLQILFALLGWLASGYLLVQHTRLKSGIQESASFCSFGKFADCDVVNSSDFSEIAGFPLASFGVLFYFACLLLSLVSRPKDGTFHRSQRVLLLATFAGAAVDIFLSLVQAISLNTFCLVCAFTYLCTIGLMISTLMMTEAATWKSRLRVALASPRATEAFKWPVPGLALGAWLIMLAAVILVPSYIRIKSQTYSMVDNALDQFFRTWKDKPIKKIEITPEDGTLGAPGSRIKIVAFSDFQCPHCKKAAFTLHTWMKSVQGRIYFGFKNYPLDSSCNTGLQYQMHPQACLLAKLSLCAGEKGKFWEFHDLVFLQLSSDTIEGGLNSMRPALEKILPGGEIDACLKNEKVSRKLAEDIRTGTAIGVPGTPAVYINGKHVTIPLTVENLNRLIEIEAAPAR